MTDNYFLDFEIRTTQFLGHQNVANGIVDVLSKLPKKYILSKCVGPNDEKKAFSIKSPENFIAIVPGLYTYEGHASLYKVNNILFN